MAARKTTGTDVIDWEKEMREQARIAAEAQRSTGGGGKFFSMQAGQLQYDGNPMPGNRMAVVILADVLMNTYYDGPYDPNNKVSPKCFAFAKDEDDLEPHEDVDKDDYFERQSPTCPECPWNEWGSAETGRGKACKNSQRLGMIPAGVYKASGKGRDVKFELELYDDPGHFQRAEVAYMNLPVMSVRNYGQFVKQVAADLGRPPHGVLAEVWLEPDAKSQFKVMFEVIDVVPNDIIPIVMERHRKEQATIDFPYQPPLDEEAAQPTKTNNKLARKAPAKKAPAKGRR